ncbi:MAG: phosphatidylglycerol lysyltransferase domain-containing protein [Candidatus Pelethousia sp.]|nr:phosphatidylglycerol lysyltransferase domain-containing protein [Candidatus Pelethousia sp.]
MGIEKTTLENTERAYRIINECSADSQHYLSLGEENRYFFGTEIFGAISYVLAGKKAMSLGDPVCKFKDIERFIGEYINFCNKMGYKPIFNSVSSDVAEILRTYNYSVIKYGEEAVLKLAEYTLAGGQKAVLRHNVNKVNKSGVTLQEYCPKNGRDYFLEGEISELADQWFADKRFKLNYSVGNLHFDKPYERRYFVTKDKDGNLLTILSFLPYEGGNGFCIDVMYRKLDAPTGVMEHALISAIMKMKNEGANEVSLGLAPLAGIDVTKPDVSRAEKLMNAVFHNMNFGYDFKNLHRFKKKFDPTTWKPRYLAYHRGISLVDLAIAITNTKRGSADIGLYVKYKVFIISFTIFPGLYSARNK